MPAQLQGLLAAPGLAIGPAVVLRRAGAATAGPVAMPVAESDTVGRAHRPGPARRRRGAHVALGPAAVRLIALDVDGTLLDPDKGTGLARVAQP